MHDLLKSSGTSFCVLALLLSCALAGGPPYEGQTRNVAAGRAWLPADFTVPEFTVSPDGRYGVMMPDIDTCHSGQSWLFKQPAILKG